MRLMIAHGRSRGGALLGADEVIVSGTSVANVAAVSGPALASDGVRTYVSIVPENVDVKIDGVAVPYSAMLTLGQVMDRVSSATGCPVRGPATIAPSVVMGTLDRPITLRAIPSSILDAASTLWSIKRALASEH